MGVFLYVWGLSHTVLICPDKFILCSHVTPLREDTWKLVPDYSWTFLHESSPFADFAIFLFLL